MHNYFVPSRHRGPPPYVRPRTLPAPIIPCLLRHIPRLPTWARSPDKTGTHAMQSSYICGRETNPPGKPPDSTSPLDVAPPVHHDAASTGPSAQRPRLPVHSRSQADNCHTSGPPVRHRWAVCPARLMYLTMAPLANPHLVLHSIATGSQNSM